MHELAFTGNGHEKSDIYSLGVLMLQLIMRDDPVGDVPKTNKHANQQLEAVRTRGKMKKNKKYDMEKIHISVKAACEGKVKESVVDRKLEEQISKNKKEAAAKGKRISELALCCCSQQPNSRPTFENIIDELARL